MACGGPERGQASRVLCVLALSVCAIFALPAYAQNDQPPESPPVADQPAQPAPDVTDEPQTQFGSSAAGRVPVEGLPEAIFDRVRDLLREEAAPESLFDARRQAERAAAVIATVMESEGYYQAEVEPFARGQNTFTRGVRVTPGPLFIYASRKIAYLDTKPDDRTFAELETLLAPLDTGLPARAQPVIETGDALVARLKAAGYPDASADPVDVLADAKAGTIDLEFRLRPGLRASFGKLAVTGLGVTNEQFIQNLRPWKDGDIITPQLVDEFRGRLAETGLFSSTAVKLDAAPPADGQAPTPRELLVQVNERPRRTIAIGASASTSDGYGLDAEWQLRNWSGWGDTVAITGQIATLQRKIGVSYRLPHIGKYGRILKLATDIEDLDTDAYNQTGANVSATLEEQLSPRVRGSLGVEAGYASILDQAARAAGTGRRDVYIISGTGTAEYVGVRDILDPVNGFRARVAVEPGFTWGDTTIAFTKVSGEASAYYDFNTKDLVGAVRGRLGTIAGPNGAPPDRLFFAGGGGSVRGYDYQSLSPRDAAGLLIGGRSLVEVSAELRYRINDTFGVVGFLDGGAAGANIEPPIDSMRFGTGVGLRYYTAFGPLRADFAVPLNKKTGDADFQIYISIGQAF